jgi:hypothetical protein
VIVRFRMSDKLISQKTSTGLLLALTAVVVVTFSLLPQIPQPQSYHLFADRRGFVGIPNFGDVVSNVPFGVIGICGLLFLLCSSPGQLKERFLDPRERWPYVLVFIGLLLTAFGSSYYHLSPNNARLVWDRLPMTIAFMAMVAAIISERISLRAGLWLLPLLLLIGNGQRLAMVCERSKGCRRSALLCGGASVFGIGVVACARISEALHAHI